MLKKVMFFMLVLILFNLPAVLGQSWAPYYSGPNYQPVGWNNYPAGSWIGGAAYNPYMSWVGSYGVYDQWGYRYGYASMDYNGANSYMGYNTMNGPFRGYPGWP